MKSNGYGISMYILTNDVVFLCLIYINKSTYTF